MSESSQTKSCESECRPLGNVNCLLNQLADGADVQDDDSCGVCNQPVAQLESQALSLGRRLKYRPDELGVETACLRLIEERAAAQIAWRVLSIPEEIGPYQIRELLGRGGMGAVYRATHKHLKKDVAIKLLPAEAIGNGIAITRFKREIESVGKLNHPNVVHAMDAGLTEGGRFLIMELVPGADLSRIVAGGKSLAIGDACEMVRQAALGLQHAHEQGLIHRDVKPSNLMLAEDAVGQPVVKVMDLGLALLAEGESTQLTDQGHLMGTLEFMAPEQATNRVPIDHRADIYSLGATLYRLLTGTIPFQGKQYDTTVKRLYGSTNHDAPPVIGRRSDLPDNLAELVDRMLCRDPTSRPQSMQEVADLLTPFTSTHDLSAICKDLAELPPPLLHNRRRDVAGDASFVVQVATSGETPSFAERTVRTGIVDDTGSKTPPHQDTESASTSARSAPSLALGESSPPRSRLVSVALASASIFVLLAGLIWLKTTDGGYVRIEADPSVEIEIQVLSEGTLVDTFAVNRDHNRFWCRTGRYELRLPIESTDSMMIDRTSVTLTRGGREVVNVSRVDNVLVERKNVSPMPDMGVSDRSSGLVGKWDFEDLQGSHVEDRSGNGLHGILNSPIAKSTPANGPPLPGNVNALEIGEPERYMEVDNASTLNFVNAITIVMWIRGELGDGTSHMRVVSKSSPTDGYNLTLLGVKSSVPGLVVFNTINRDAPGIAAKSKTGVLDGTWHHVVGTFDGVDLKVYVDGVLEDTKTPHHLIGVCDNNLRIGNDGRSTFQADIDEVSLYSRALSAAEINATMRN